MFILYKVKCVGKENVLSDGAVIICSNHVGFIDPVTVAVTTKRQIHFMAKKELFKNMFFKALFNGLGAIPVDRQSGRDISAIKSSTKILKDGKVLGIFFQGTRVNSESTEQELKNVKSGVALFALKTKSPIIPTLIQASYKFRSTVYIKYGEPIYLDEFYDKRINQETLDEVINLVSEKILKLET